MTRRAILLTDGVSDSHTAKTAINLLRYRPGDVVAVLDRTAAGKSCQEVFGVGGAIPLVAQLSQAPAANMLLIGIAPPGGRMPASWRDIVLEAIARKLDVVSGLHEFLNDDPAYVRAARGRASV